jgi:hypothetical protein
MSSPTQAKERLDAAPGSAFEADIERLQAARKSWHESMKLPMAHEDLEREMTIAQWQRSQTGDDLAECIREVIRFLKPQKQSVLDALLWESVHRLSGKKTRKMEMDRRIEQLMQNVKMQTTPESTPK